VPPHKSFECRGVAATGPLYQGSVSYSDYFLCHLTLPMRARAAAAELEDIWPPETVSWFCKVNSDADLGLFKLGSEKVACEEVVTRRSPE